MKIFFLSVILLLLLLVGAESVAAQNSIDSSVLRQSFRLTAVDSARQHDDKNGRRTVRVGLYENKPKIYTDESGEAAGIFPAILGEIAHREKWQLTYVSCEWSECLEALQEERIDLMPDVATSSKRRKKFDFHIEEVVTAWSTLYANKGENLNNIADLDGKQIAVLDGSIQQRYLKQLLKGLGFKVTFIAVDSFNKAFLLTANGNADAVVTNYFFGDYFYQQYGLQKTPLVFNPVSLYFATAIGSNLDLLQKIDSNLRFMKSEPGSVYYQALARWMDKPPKTVIPKKIIWTLAGITALLFFAVLFIFLLRWQVRLATQHLTKTNELLRNSEKKFQDLFYQHVVVKLLIDPDKGDIIEANNAAGKFYGWSPEELRQMRIQDIIIHRPNEEDESAIESNKSLDCVQLESSHRLANGSSKDVMMFTSRIDIQGKNVLHSIVHDITERHQLEEQLRMAQKMESVGRLAGGVAHDYNNMLTVILGYTDMILKEMDRNNPLRSDLKEILNAARRSSSITRQLLTFARKQIATPVILDLNETVEGMLKILRRLTGEDIKLMWLPEIGSAPLKIDPAQVDQILANLCVNARDAIDDVGRITIKTDCVTFDAMYCTEHSKFACGEFIQLSVSDNGCGMDKETLAHIFDPFFTTKSMGMGTGLGLATVYGIVKQNKGFIHVDSKPGKGTDFFVYLPRYMGKDDGGKVEHAEEIRQGHGETVLLVEDDYSIMTLARKMLEQLGYQVLTAATPAIALRMAEEQGDNIDLLLTDVVMPEMNGHELADQLRSVCPDLQVVFMSGYTDDIIMQRGVSNNGINFLSKPFSQRELANIVSKALGI